MQLIGIISDLIFCFASSCLIWLASLRATTLVSWLKFVCFIWHIELQTDSVCVCKTQCTLYNLPCNLKLDWKSSKYVQLFVNLRALSGVCFFIFFWVKKIHLCKYVYVNIHWYLCLKIYSTRIIYDKLKNI